jgi:hypothetical protein
MQKYIFGKAGLKNLIYGIIFLFIAVVLIVWVYSYLNGMVSTLGAEEYITMKPEGVIGLFYFGFGILFFGSMGGYEIGRYVEMEFSKRRTETTTKKLGGL